MLIDSNSILDTSTKKTMSQVFDFSKEYVTIETDKNTIYKAGEGISISSDNTISLASQGDSTEVESTDTSTSSSFKVAVGDNQPVGAHLWYNTSDYVSVQGETPTRIITIDDTENPVVRGNTRPSKTGVFWWNTSNYGGGSD